MPISTSPVYHVYIPFLVKPISTIVGVREFEFIFGVSKTFTDQFREQNPEYQTVDSQALDGRIFELKRNTITICLGEMTPNFEMQRIEFDALRYPPVLPERKYRISNDNIAIWDNKDAGFAIVQNTEVHRLESR